MNITRSTTPKELQPRIRLTSILLTCLLLVILASGTRASCLGATTPNNPRTSTTGRRQGQGAELAPLGASLRRYSCITNSLVPQRLELGPQTSGIPPPQTLHQWPWHSSCHQSPKMLFTDTSSSVKKRGQSGAHWHQGSCSHPVVDSSWRVGDHPLPASCHPRVQWSDGL